MYGGGVHSILLFPLVARCKTYNVLTIPGGNKSHVTIGC